MNLNNLNLPPERRKALEQVLDQAWKDYQDNLTNLTDAAADEIETVLERDPLNARETVREYTAAANRLADDYYATVRTAWAEYAGVAMPSTLDLTWNRNGYFGRSKAASPTPTTTD